MIRESGGRASELTHKIAKAGKFGQHKQNIARDINRALKLPLAAGFANWTALILCRV